MPVNVRVTCDICGEAPAAQYRSFFQIKNASEGWLVPTDIPGLFKDAEREPVIDTRGCLNSDLRVCLCRDHFVSIEEMLKAWLEGQLLTTEVHGG